MLRYLLPLVVGLCLLPGAAAEGDAFELRTRQFDEGARAAAASTVVAHDDAPCAYRAEGLTSLARRGEEPAPAIEMTHDAGGQLLYATAGPLLYHVDAAAQSDSSVAEKLRDSSDCIVPAGQAHAAVLRAILIELAREGRVAREIRATDRGVEQWRLELEVAR